MDGQRRKGLWLLPLWAIVAVILGACHRNGAEVPDFAKLEGEIVSLDSACAVIPSPNDWTDLYAPVAITTFAPEKSSISGRATIANGKWIHFSLRAMGMEVAIVHIEGDSVIIHDKYHKKYETGSISAIFAYHGATVADIQQLLLGLPIAESALPAGCTAVARIGMASPASDAPALSSISIESAAADRLVAMYANRIDSPAGLIAQNIDIQAIAGSNKFVASFAFKLDEAQWNTGRGPKRPIPPAN